MKILYWVKVFDGIYIYKGFYGDRDDLQRFIDRCWRKMVSLEDAELIKLWNCLHQIVRIDEDRRPDYRKYFSDSKESYEAIQLEAERKSRKRQSLMKDKQKN